MAKKRYNTQIERIERYKRKFLYSDFVKRSASTILVGLTKDKEIDEVNIIYKTYKIKKIVELIKCKVEKINKEFTKLVERKGITEELVELAWGEVKKTEEYSTKELSEFVIKKFIELIKDKAENIDDKMEEGIIKKLELTEDEIKEIDNKYTEFKNTFKPTFEELLRG